jgi:hypothetical protein
VNPTLRSTFFSFPILKHQKETKIHWKMNQIGPPWNLGVKE